MRVRAAAFGVPEQKAFSVQADETGEWHLLGLTAGVWVFVASAPDPLPSVAVLPTTFAQRQMQSAPRRAAQPGAATRTSA